MDSRRVSSETILRFGLKETDLMCGKRVCLGLADENYPRLPFLVNLH